MAHQRSVAYALLLLLMVTANSYSKDLGSFEARTIIGELKESYLVQEANLFVEQLVDEQGLSAETRDRVLSQLKRFIASDQLEEVGARYIDEYFSQEERSTLARLARSGELVDSNGELVPQLQRVVARLLPYLYSWLSDQVR